MFVVLLPLAVKAQSFYGSVVGTVIDATGAVVPDATVTVTNLGTAEVVKVKSGADGQYSVVNLVPASYNVTVEKVSFKRLVRNAVPVQVGATTRVDLSLAVGNANETVQVTSSVPLLQTDSSSLSQEVEGQQVQDMPLNGRNVMNLIALAPGVIPGGSSQGDTALDQGTRSNNAAWNNYQIGGGLGNEAAQFIDGAPNNLLGGNIAALVPTQDAVQEFSVVSSNATADFGRFAGGVVNMTTKSGTNALHGSVYEYFRNTDFNANNWFNNHLGIARPKWNQNQYGAAVNGPIKRDKAFFMFTWEGFKVLTGDLDPTNVPTAAMQNGVFTSTLKPDPLGICDVEPYTGQTVNGQTFASGGTYIANLYGPGKVAGTTCGDPLNQILKTFYPLPNVNSTADNWYLTTPLKNDQNQYNGRVDYQLGAHRIFGRYTYLNLKDSEHSEFLDKGLGSSTWPTNDSSVEIFTHQAVLGDTVTLNPTTVLDVRASYTRTTMPVPVQTSTYDEATFGADYAALAPQMDLHILPEIRINGGDSLWAFATYNYSENWWNNYALSASLVKIKGAHSIKVGGEGRLMDETATGFPSAVSGTYTYTNAVVGDEFAAFLMGYPNTSGTNYATQFETFQNTAAYTYYQGYYVTDTWQAARDLTLNLGLRYELPGAVAERNNKDTVLLPNTVDPVTGITGTLGLVASPIYKPRTTAEEKYDLFAPRVGFAYRASSNTVFHGGYGLSYLPNDLAGLGGNGVLPFVSPINQDNTTVNVPSGVATPLQTILGCLSGNISTSAPGSPCNDSPLAISHAGLAPPPGRSKGQGFMSQLGSLTKYLGQPISGAVPFKPYPYVQQWNIALSHEFKGDFMAEVSYSGLHGSHMPGMGGNFPGPYGLDELPSQYYPLIANSISANGKTYNGLSAPVGTPGATACTNAPGLGGTITVGQCLRPYPYYSNVGDIDALLAHQNYASLQVSAEKRFKSAGIIKGNYSWSQNKDDADTETGSIEKGGAVQGVGAVTAPQDYNNLAAEYTIVAFNVKNRAIVDYLLNLPFGKGQKYANNLTGVADAIASGWAIDGITTFQSGFPIWLITANANLLTSTLGGGTLRPNVVAGCNKKVSGSSQARVLAGAWFNTSCFKYPSSSYDPTGQVTFGNEPRVDSDLNADGIKNFDFSLQKSTPIFEKSNFVFRAEFFNIFNRVQFAPPFPKEGASNFGTVSYQLNQPRQIQLSARVNF